MSDDAPSPLASPPAPSSPPDDQAARIDQLLTAGLDEYFAGRYDGAVQVWSRVFFLDRTNARARAYIERARSAVAERQRVAEATAAAAVDLHRGWAGDTRPSEPRPVAEAGVLVVSGALAARLAPQPVDQTERVPRLDPAATAASRRARIAHVLLVGAAGVLLFVAGYTVAERDRLAELVTGVASRRGLAAKAGAAEVALHDAEQAFAARRYDDARRALARIPAGHPLRPAADVLLARIQRAWPIVSPMLAPHSPVGGAGAPVAGAGVPVGGAGSP
jgi:hypothetical protein